MPKSFKLRLSRAIPSFNSCLSKHPSSLPANPVPSFLPPPKTNASDHLSSTPTPLPVPTPRPSKPHSAAAFCCLRLKPPPLNDLSDNNIDNVEIIVKWGREGEWHVDDTATPKCKKMYNTSEDELPSPTPPPPTQEKRKHTRRRSRRKRRKAATRMLRLSTSSPDSRSYFSSEGAAADHYHHHHRHHHRPIMFFQEEEDSRSFSTDIDFSSDSNTLMGRKKGRRMQSTEEESEGATEARLSVFQRLIPCVVEGKVRESYAVVKKSAEPYEDFKRSMLEMILEKSMFEEEDLEQLLHCFLSLNARHHHAAIVRAFAEIWNTLFCTTAASSILSSR